ncbi:MAG: hypothetical protein H0W96_09285, partial [Solirubrobacterales bacterium]|nr:hypothetical protein [Solirubrobacterales bacterium]
MKFGKRRKGDDDDAADTSPAAADVTARTDAVAETWTVPAGATPAPPTPAAPTYSGLEPAVDSEAVELVGDVAPAPGPPMPPVAFTVPERPAPAVPASGARSYT